MGAPIPAWGLFRLLKGLEAKGISGCLDVSTADGLVTFGLQKGRLYQAESEVPVLGFGAYLVRARMVPDPATAERLASTHRLVDAGIIRAEDASKLHGSYVRSVLSKVLPLPASDWTFQPASALVGVMSDHPVDPFPELLRATTRDGQMATMRAVVERARAPGRMSLSSGYEFALSHVKSHFGELKVLFVLRQDRSEDITDAMMEEEDTIRVLFALIVAGLLHAAPAQASPPSSAAAAVPPSPVPAEAVPGGVPSPRHPDPARRPVFAGPRNPVHLAGVSSPFEKELRNAWLEMQNRNHFEVMGIPVDARESAIQIAWMKAHAQFARARYEGVVPAEALELLDKIHCHLDAVRDILLDRGRRTHYNRQIGVSTPSLDSRIVEICEARSLWRAGVELLQTHRPGDALAQFEAAGRQDPQEPEYRVFQAWAVLAMPPAGDNNRRARLLVEEALKVEPDLVEGLVCLATIDRVDGRFDEARESIRRALALDPEHAEARAMKDLLRARGAGPKVTFQKNRTSLVDRLVAHVKRKLGG